MRVHLQALRGSRPCAQTSVAVQCDDPNSNPMRPQHRPGHPSPLGLFAERCDVRYNFACAALHCGRLREAEPVRLPSKGALQDVSPWRFWGRVLPRAVLVMRTVHVSEAKTAAHRFAVADLRHGCYNAAARVALSSASPMQECIADEC